MLSKLKLWWLENREIVILKAIIIGFVIFVFVPWFVGVIISFKFFIKILL